MTTLDSDLDLSFTREVPVTADLVWRAWTEPALILKWFTPRPWRTTDAEVDLRPGGIFRTEMAGPDGEIGGGTGCFLEVVPERRLVWTGALLPGYRPAIVPADVPVFTAIIELEPIDGGTRYTATVLHATSEHRQVHADMGFEAGWGAALDQLVELMTAG